MRLSSINLFRFIVLGFYLILVFFVSSCEKHKDEKIPFDALNSEKWNKAFIDTRKTFQLEEVKKIVFENPCDANQCILIRGGSYLEGPDVVYNKYIKKQIPSKVAKKLIRENMGERTNLFFLKDDIIISSIKLISVDSDDRIYYGKIEEQITFSIQLPPELSEHINNDPNFFEHPEIGQDYLTNPNRLKPIEIIKIE